MNSFRVVEHFVSVNGEGRRAGQLALFIRFAGCNLACEYCDTKWANESDVPFEEYSLEELLRLIGSSGVTNVTLTGGEPLMQPGMKALLTRLRKEGWYRIEIETNGSIDIRSFIENIPQIPDGKGDNVSFTLDYKLSASRMEEQMCRFNYTNLRATDAVKFVVANREDLLRTKKLIEEFQLIRRRCGIYISPCFGMIEPATIVDFLIEHRMNDVNIQLQLHKYIWDPDKRGV